MYFLPHIAVAAGLEIDAHSHGPHHTGRTQCLQPVSVQIL